MVILGIVLLLTGAGLLVAEAHLPTYGILGLAGLASLVAGGVIAVDASGGGVALVLAVGLVMTLIAGVALAAVVRGAAAVARRPARTGGEGILGHVGVVRQVLEPVGQVFVDGALWRARPAWEEPGDLREGDQVVVEQINGLTLSVRRAEEWELQP
ncbi:MAG TPA: NfeD family protein [Solirubrobacteraceae bacterium]|nr:NfeD family protein [Solirubrobacteraceae bacterium]